MTRKEMVEAIIRKAYEQPGFDEGREVTLRLWLLTSPTPWIVEQYQRVSRNS